MNKHLMYRLYIKRLFDVVISAIVIVLCLPIYLLILVLELKYHGFPPTYNSVRAGKDCKPFLLLKFRSMTNEKDENGNLLPNENRLTKFGRFLRTTSLDETPEFINILKGDMSLVGPRPLPMEYIELYDKTQIKKMTIRPGLACPRLNGGDKYPSWEEQFSNEVWYSENISFLLDVKMVIAIFRAVFSRKRSRVRGEAKREAFTGTKT